MWKPWPIIILMLVASCTVGPRATQPRGHPAWMVGKWGWIDASEESELQGDCSPEIEFYRRDGYVVSGQTSARWWIEGDELVRVGIGEAYGENVEGKVYRNRFTRIAPGVLLFESAETTQKLVRCGDVPREWKFRPVE